MTRAIRFDDADRAALRAYWQFYEPRSAAIADDLRSQATRLVEWKAVIEATPPEAAAEQERRGRQLQRMAIVEDQWEPYLDDLRTQGIRYAEAGVSYAAWIELIAAFRNTVRRHIVQFAREDLERAATASHGLSCFLDIAIEHIGEAYLLAKQRLVTTAEQRFRTMFEQSPLAMWTFDRETLRFVAVNDAAIQHYGYTRDEFLAMTIADIRPPEDLVALRDSVRDAIGFVPHQTWRHRKSDGTLIDVEIAANDFVEGSRSLRLVVINDVTERQRAADKLRRAE